jgi:hypothetical protein
MLDAGSRECVDARFAIYFVRKRVPQPQSSEQERRDTWMMAELKQLSWDEEAHLEKEFEDYDRLYPRE